MLLRILRRSGPAAAAVVALAAVSCDAGGPSRPAGGDAPANAAAAEDTAVRPAALRVDPAHRERLAAELEAAAAATKAHVYEMRGLLPSEWRAEMEDHVHQVRGLLDLVDRQMREMDVGMDDARVGDLMGMTADEHRRTMDDMQALRTEAEALRAASEADLRDRMPVHLSRLARFVQQMEQAAAHLRAT
jgi:hypothetical protein